MILLMTGIPLITSFTSGLISHGMLLIKGKHLITFVQSISLNGMKLFWTFFFLRGGGGGEGVSCKPSVQNYRYSTLNLG